MIYNRPAVHHDGSSLFVSNASPELGDVVQIQLRVYEPQSELKVFVRTVFDGEPSFIEAVLLQSENSFSLYQAELPIRNKTQHYRWLLSGGTFGYKWFNERGLYAYDVSDSCDFKIVAFEQNPEWMRKSVAYQIFPDRFSRSSRTYEAPDYLVPREWNRRPEGKSPNTGKEWFGGDLWGIAEKIEYLKELQVDLIYLTPIFAAHSTHRYDAHSFFKVDPLLGGDEALIHLVETAHKNEMKVVGDITLNHCGRYHEWFISALEGDEEKREFFTFDDQLPHGYECWLGHASLPKFNFESKKLREILLTSDSSVLKYWLQKPFNLDGWRVDVANMAGRQGGIDLTHEIARIARKEISKCGSEKILIAEHFHDAGSDLVGDGWQGGMNYTAVKRPVWNWLSSEEFLEYRKDFTERKEAYSAIEAIKTVQDFSSKMPWRSRVASWSLVGSHDTARIRSVVGSEERQVAAAALLIGLPGTPMIFMGDEIGSEGLWGEDSRTTMQWDEIYSSDSAIHKAYRDLLKLRRESDALANGGIEWIAANDDAMAFVRESNYEKLLFVIARFASILELPQGYFSNTNSESIFGNFAIDSDTVNINQAGASIWRINL